MSIIKACDHRTEEDDAPYWLCETIEQRLLRSGANTNSLVTTEDISKACLATLKAFDTPAFVKYLSYHAPSIDDRSLKRALKK